VGVLQLACGARALTARASRHGDGHVTGPGGDVHALDAAVREISADPGRTWGVRDAVLGVLAVPLSLGVGLLILVLAPGLPGLAGTGVAMLALTVLTVLLARRAAQQSGGVRRALASVRLGLPTWGGWSAGRSCCWSCRS
jgi:hypothetical protein